ncbi:MAG: RnfABCDGE type electron transport complex subunit D [Eubacteriales bacterium]
MNDSLYLSVSPHIHSPITTTRIMLDVIIALLPASVAGVIIFGLRALAVIAVCVAAAVISEYLFNLIAKKPLTINDLSAVVTGLLLALNLPASIPLWQAAIGAVFAIVCVKCVFGGIGQNFANPAITARIFMLIAFGSMTSAAFPKIVDVSAGATPLVTLSEGGKVELTNLLLGLRGGAIGETCAIALIIGGIYLIARKVITWQTPVVFIATVFLFTFAVKADALLALEYTLSGGLIIGAFFMATDYATTPITKWGKVIFGLGAGIFTVLIRFWGVYPEGVSFAILFMNILTPYIDKWTAKKPFGGEKA